ncbi:MAG: hypothetical protein AAF363_18670 [Bacteroidota bacterium]
MNPSLVEGVLYLMVFLTIAVIAGVATIHGGDMIKGIKGHNNRWDAPEIIIILFLPPTLATIFVVVFLQLPVDSNILWLEAGGLGIGNLARVGVEATKAMKNKKDEAIGDGNEK